MPRRDLEDELRRWSEEDDHPRHEQSQPDDGPRAAKRSVLVYGALGLVVCLSIGGHVALIRFGARQIERRQLEAERLEAADSKKAPIVIAPAGLVAAYGSEVTADNRYKNKWLRV